MVYDPTYQSPDDPFYMHMPYGEGWWPTSSVGQPYQGERDPYFESLGWYESGGGNIFSPESPQNNAGGAWNPYQIALPGMIYSGAGLGPQDEPTGGYGGGGGGTAGGGPQQTLPPMASPQPTDPGAPTPNPPAININNQSPDQGDNTVPIIPTFPAAPNPNPNMGPNPDMNVTDETVNEDNTNVPFVPMYGDGTQRYEYGGNVDYNYGGDVNFRNDYNYGGEVGVNYGGGVGVNYGGGVDLGGDFNYNYNINRPDFQRVSQELFSGPYARNYPQEIQTTLGAQRQLMPQLYDAERGVSSDWVRLNQRALNEGMFGSQGGLPLIGRAAQGFQGVQEGLDTRQREKGLQDVQNLLAQYQAIQEGTTPYTQPTNQRIFESQQGQGFTPQNAVTIGSTSLDELMNTQAIQGLQQGLTDRQQRDITQGVRSGWAARGLERSSGAVADEVEARLRADMNLQDRNRAFAGSVYGQKLGRMGMNQNAINQMRMFNAQGGLQGQQADRNYLLASGQYFDQVGGDAFSDIMSMRSSALPMAQNYYGQQQGINQQAGPRYFDPHSPYAQGVYAGNQQTRLGLDMAANNADASTWNAIIGAGGQIGSQLPWGDIFSGIGDIFGWS